jgi:hypothetical protein
MKHAVEMDSGVIMYILSFIKIGSDNQKLMLRIHRHPDTLTYRHTEA